MNWPSLSKMPHSCTAGKEEVKLEQSAEETDGQVVTLAWGQKATATEQKQLVKKVDSSNITCSRYVSVAQIGLNAVPIQQETHACDLVMQACSALVTHQSL